MSGSFALAALVHPEDFDDFPEGYDTDINIKKTYYIDFVRTDTDMLNACGYGKKIARNTPHLISDIDWNKYM